MQVLRNWINSLQHLQNSRVLIKWSKFTKISCLGLLHFFKPLAIQNKTSELLHTFKTLILEWDLRNIA